MKNPIAWVTKILNQNCFGYREIENYRGSTLKSQMIACALRTVLDARLRASYFQMLLMSKELHLRVNIPNGSFVDVRVTPFTSFSRLISFVHEKLSGEIASYGLYSSDARSISFDALWRGFAFVSGSHILPWDTDVHWWAWSRCVAQGGKSSINEVTLQRVSSDRLPSNLAFAFEKDYYGTDFRSECVFAQDRADVHQGLYGRFLNSHIYLNLLDTCISMRGTAVFRSTDAAQVREIFLAKAPRWLADALETDEADSIFEVALAHFRERAGSKGNVGPATLRSFYSTCVRTFDLYAPYEYMVKPQRVRIAGDVARPEYVPREMLISISDQVVVCLIPETRTVLWACPLCEITSVSCAKHPVLVLESKYRRDRLELCCEDPAMIVQRLKAAAARLLGDGKGFLESGFPLYAEIVLAKQNADAMANKIGMPIFPKAEQLRLVDGSVAFGPTYGYSAFVVEEPSLDVPKYIVASILRELCETSTTENAQCSFWGTINATAGSIDGDRKQVIHGTAHIAPMQPPQHSRKGRVPWKPDLTAPKIDMKAALTMHNEMKVHAGSAGDFRGEKKREKNRVLSTSAVADKPKKGNTVRGSDLVAPPPPPKSPNSLTKVPPQESILKETKRTAPAPVTPQPPPPPPDKHPDLVATSMTALSPIPAPIIVALPDAASVNQAKTDPAPPQVHVPANAPLAHPQHPSSPSESDGSNEEPLPSPPPLVMSKPKAPSTRRLPTQRHVRLKSLQSQVRNSVQLPVTASPPTPPPPPPGPPPAL